MKKQSTPISSGLITFYRNDDSLLIHKGPAGWLRGVSLLVCGLFFLCFFGAMSAAICHEMLYGDDDCGQALFLFIFVSAFLPIPIYGIYAAFRLAFGTSTLLIDRDTIRDDWWFFGGKRSRIYTRPANIHVDLYEGDTMFGGKWGIRLVLGKTWFGTRQLTRLFWTENERKQAIKEIRQFQDEIPATSESATENTTVRKGSVLDSDFGENLLKTLFRNEKPYRKIELEEYPEPPLNENLEQESKQLEQDLQPGRMYFRCGKCDRVLPCECVDVERPLAHCPYCDFLFEPWSFHRLYPQKPKTYEIRREKIGTENESLEIVQKPNRGPIPCFTILTVLLCNIGFLALYLWIQNLYPGENPLSHFRADHDPSVEIGSRIAPMFGIFTIHFLSLAFWTFFERRTVRIDWEKMELSVHWLFFHWKRTVPRVLVRKSARSSDHDLEFFYVFPAFLLCEIQILYGKKTFWLGSNLGHEGSWACTEINRFLFEVPPQDKEQDSKATVVEPVLLGGSSCGESELELHCPYCGTIIASDLIDVPKRTAQCKTCEKAFPLEQVLSCEKFDFDRETFPPPHIQLEETPNVLTLHCESNASTGEKYFTGLLAFGLIVFFGFGAIFFAVAPFISDEFDTVQKFVFGVLFAPFMLVFIFFLSMIFIDEFASYFSSWKLRLDSKNLELTLRYPQWKKWCHFAMDEKTIVIPRKEIVAVCPNQIGEFSSFKNFGILGSVPDYICSRRNYSSHLLLKDGTKYYLPRVAVVGSGYYANQSNLVRLRNGVVATLNRFLASHPAEIFGEK